MRAATRIHQIQGAACSSSIPCILLSLSEYVCSRKQNREYLTSFCTQYTACNILIFKRVMRIFIFYLLINWLKLKYRKKPTREHGYRRYSVLTFNSDHRTIHSY